MSELPREKLGLDPVLCRPMLVTIACCFRIATNSAEAYCLDRNGAPIQEKVFASRSKSIINHGSGTPPKAIPVCNEAVRAARRIPVIPFRGITESAD
jgi:hypothetical protein